MRAHDRLLCRRHCAYTRSPTAAALHAKDWATARQAKTAVEQAERELRKQREAAPPEGIPGQLGPFTPQFFELPEGGASDWAVADGVLAACLADCS